jgi:hypothetical protein
MARASGAIDWQRRVIKASGQGAPDLNAPSIAVARLSAERAAIATAQRNALEVLQGATLENGSTVGAVLQNDGDLRQKVEGKLRGVRAANTHYFSDGGVSLEIEVPLDQLPPEIADRLKPPPGDLGPATRPEPPPSGETAAAQTSAPAPSHDPASPGAAAGEKQLDVAAPAPDGNAVHVTVRNVTSLAQAAAFKGAIAQRLRRVKAVAQRSYAEGTQELDVTLAGSTEEFAQQLEAKRLGKFTVRVTALSAKSVEVELGR